MKVVLIGTNSSSIFGFRKLLLKSLVEAGHDVRIMTADLTPEIKRRAKEELNVEAERYLLARRGMNPLLDLKNAWHLYRRLRSLNPDVVFCYFSKPVIWGALTSRLAGVERRYGMLEGLGYFFTAHPGGDGWKKTLVRAAQVALFRLSLPLLNGLVVLNPDDRKDLVDKYRIPVKDVMVLGGIGLDLDEYLYSRPASDRNRFIFVGRLLQEKGISEYLAAAEMVKSRHPDAEFVILGKQDPGNPGSVDLDYMNRLVGNGVIIYPGVVTNVVDWLESSSVFVLPSYREGVPRSTQEAMAVGRPVITTDVPGCRETIRDGENGFIVPPHDAAAVAEAMERFIAQPDLIVSMGCRSRELAEKAFDADEINRRLMNYLELQEIEHAPGSQGITTSPCP
ncbi:glycosyltransferase family 4 protein [Halomonas sp. JS92-SW72]|uniref:glycosyltransferase family 4 protein n=1 Tax=Halomonas sp. JS92-SW72 TaxID=2306583 RepID=UPI000E5BBF67|nr:glycosyltransferase family 4 protein [Halomonas sp. JS92-SW72]AXY44359.1 glycosyltransferase family 1 protein [Halomonas sp. JS92-SW72]